METVLALADAGVAASRIGAEIYVPNCWAARSTWWSTGPPPWPASTNPGPPGPWPFSTTTTSGSSRPKGEFTRHRHLETDEVFLVLSGSLTIRLDDDEVTLGPGQLYVVPRGVHHQPVSVEGADVVLIESSTTGEAPSHLTAERRLD